MYTDDGARVRTVKYILYLLTVDKFIFLEASRVLFASTTIFCRKMLIYM